LDSGERQKARPDPDGPDPDGPDPDGLTD